SRGVDRRRSNCRGNLPDSFGHGEVVRLAVLVVGGLVGDGRNGFVRRALLWRTSFEISRGRRWLCLSSRSLRSPDSFSVWVDGSACDGSWSHGSTRRRPRKLRRIHVWSDIFSP